MGVKLGLSHEENTTGGTGFWVPTAMTMVGTIFRDVRLCSPVDVPRRFEKKTLPPSLNM
jgi:hypothetical protein